MNISIEKLQAKDLDEFFKVFSEVIQNDFPGYTRAVIDYFLNKVYTKYSFFQWLSNGAKIVLIAKSTERIIGFAVLDQPYGGVCFLRWLGVLPEFRKNGAGRKLIEAWENYAKNYGSHKIEVAGQKNAREFYQKVGLEEEGKRKLSYFGIDQYIFGKVLGEAKDEVMTKD